MFCGMVRRINHGGEGGVGCVVECIAFGTS